MSGEYEDGRPIRPDGLAIRRLRRDRGWSRRELLEAIAEATQRATGIRETISPNLLEGIEEGTIFYRSEGLPVDFPSQS